MFRMMQPAHPGQIVKTEILDPLGLTVTAAARILGVTRPASSAVLNARSSLSPEMGLRMEKAFGVRLDTLLRIQTAYDVSKAREKEADLKVSRYVADRAVDGIDNPS